MQYTRIAVIMAGGSGERFWPLSRLTRPKQLLKLADPDRTLIQQTVDRVAPLVGLENIMVAAAPHLVNPISQCLTEMAKDMILAEPHKRNTGGCMVWLAANLLARSEGAEDTVSMAVIAADHKISPEEGFRSSMVAAMTLAEETGGLVTMGIRPNRAETGYGYIELDESARREVAGVSTHAVKSFREKPNAELAREFVNSGGFLWNSGSFFWTLGGFLNELQIAAPDLHQAVYEVADCLRRNDEAAANARFAELRNISIDFALMEKAKQVYVVEAQFDWDDVGAWDSLERSFSPDSNGNVVMGDATVVDSTGSIVYNDVPGITTTVLGVEGLVVVVTEDAVLVIPKERAQDVKQIVESLKTSQSLKL